METSVASFALGWLFSRCENSARAAAGGANESDAQVSMGCAAARGASALQREADYRPFCLAQEAFFED